MLALVNEARIYRPQLTARFVLNRCGTRTLIARDTAEALSDNDPPVLTRTIGQRVAFASAAQSGRLVSELDKETPGAREIAALVSEIDRLGIERSGVMSNQSTRQGFTSRPADPERWVKDAERKSDAGAANGFYRAPHHRCDTRSACPDQDRGFSARGHRCRHAARSLRARIPNRRRRKAMSEKPRRRWMGHPLPDDVTSEMTLVELTWEKGKIEHWIRFGRQSYEHHTQWQRPHRRFLARFNLLFCPVGCERLRHGDLAHRYLERGRTRRTLPDTALRAARRGVASENPWLAKGSNG